MRVPAPATVIEENSVGGDRLRILHEIVSLVDNGLRTFGRRNLPLRPFLAKLPSGRRPEARRHAAACISSRTTASEHWLYTAEELEAYRQQRRPERAGPRRKRGTARGRSRRGRRDRAA